MSGLSDKARVAALKACLDDLFELCKAARKAGLQVNLQVSSEDDEEEKIEEIPRVDAYLSRNYRA